MNYRTTIVTTLALTAVIFTGTTRATAGVISTVDANLITWTYDTTGTTYYFHKGSYNTAVVQPDIFGSTTGGSTEAITTALKDALNLQATTQTNMRK